MKPSQIGVVVKMAAVQLCNTDFRAIPFEPLLGETVLASGLRKSRWYGADSPYYIVREGE